MATICFRCSDDDEAKLKRAAEAEGKKLSDYVRSRVLGLTPLERRVEAIERRVGIKPVKDGNW